MLQLAEQGRTNIKMISYMRFDRCIQVLFDALAVKYMTAFCLDGVLRNIIAQAAYGRLPFFSEHTSIVLAADYEIRMASHLAHPRNQTEDIGVIYSCPGGIRRLPFGVKKKNSLLRSVPASTYVLNWRFASENRLRYSSFSSGLK